MKSTITSKGQTIIPTEICHKFKLSSTTYLEWIIEENMIRVIPIHKDTIKAFRGQGKGGSVNRLLKERSKDEKISIG